MARKAEIIYVGDAKSVVRAAQQAEKANSGIVRSASSAHVRVSKSFGGMTASIVKFGAATAGIATVTAALAGVGSATVGFDKAMRNVNSIAQLSEGRFKKLESSVLSLAGKTAQAPQTLAEGLYDLESSGFKSQKAMKVLAASAKAATAGLTDTATSTKTVAAVLNAYHLPASKAAKVSDQLFQTVNLGVVSFEELSQVIGDVLPFASSLGVGLDQVGASVATMTKAGISAPETMTRLKSVMEAFIKPSSDMAKAIKSTGSESGEALVKSKGFQGALEAVIKTTDGSKQSVAKLFPNIRALGGALALSGKNAKGAHKDIKGFKDVTGATDKALKQQSKSIAYQWQKIKATMSGVAISVGSVVVPAFSTGLQAVVTSISKAKTAFKGFLRDIDHEKHADKNNALMKRIMGPDFKPGKAKSSFGAVATVIGKSIKGAFKSIDWEGIGDTMASGLSKAFDATGKLPGAIASGISLALDNIDTKALSDKMATVAIGMIAALGDPSFWKDHWSEILSIITLVIPVGKLLKIPGAETLFNFISKPVLNAFKKLGIAGAKALGKGAGLMGKGLVDGLEKEFPRAVGKVKDLGNQVLGGIEWIVPTFKGVGRDAGESIAKGIGSAVRSVGERVGRLAGKAVKGLAGLAGRFASIGWSAVQWLAKKIIPKPVRDAVAKVARRAVSVLKGSLGKFFEIGKDTMQGLANGIRAKTGAVYEAFKTIAKKGVHLLTHPWKILSPSRTFYEIGANVVAGLTLGIVNNKGRVTDAANEALLYPIDTAIVALEAKKERLQKTWDKIDARAERAGLMRAVQRAKAGSGGGSSSGGVGGAVHGASAKAKGPGAHIFSFFKANGFSDAQAAGFVGNFRQESGLNPGAIQPGGPGRGLAQWGGSRFKALQNFAKKRGTGWKNMDTQLAFVLKELRGPESAAGRAIHAARSVSAATNAVGLKYERFGIAGNRAVYAGQAYRQFAGKFGGASSGGSGVKNEAAASREIAKNEQRIYDLRKKSRNLPAGKGHAAERKAIQDEIAALLQRNKVLKGDVKRSNAVREAIKALREFDKEAKRAKTLAKIDIQVANLQRLKAFKDAIKGIRDQVHDLAAQAAEVWRGQQEKNIEDTFNKAMDAVANSPEAKRLAELQAQDKAEQDAETEGNLKQGVDDAKQAVDDAQYLVDHSGGKTHEDALKQLEQAQRDYEKAQRDLTAFYRGQEEERLQKAIDTAQQAATDTRDTAMNGLDQQTIDYQAGLQAQFDILVAELVKRKTTYAEWAKEVNAILSQYGLSVDTDSDTESAVMGGPGPAGGSDGGPPRPGASWGGYGTYGWGGSSKPKKPKKHKAVGGWVYPGATYSVGELGREDFTPAVPGRITQASQSRGRRGGGGNVIVQGDLVVKRSTDVDRIARKLAWQLS